MPDTAPLLELQGVHLHLGGREILSDINLTVSRGELVTLIGLNGAGKSTLVRVALGLIRPDAGDVYRAPAIRVGYMPQKTVIDPILPLTVSRFLALSGIRDVTAHREALAEVGAEHCLNSPVQRLSGGEFQRVMLARAILRHPALVVLDEPVQGVDVTGQEALYQLIQQIRDRYGCGILMVSHDIHLVMAATDRVVCLNGHICCAGQPEAVSRHPEYLALFGTPPPDTLAVYTHAHDHAHDHDGRVVPLDSERHSG